MSNTETVTETVKTVQQPGSLADILRWWSDETDRCDQWADYVGVTEEALQKAFEAGVAETTGPRITAADEFEIVQRFLAQVEDEQRHIEDATPDNSMGMHQLIGLRRNAEKTVLMRWRKCAAGDDE